MLKNLSSKTAVLLRLLGRLSPRRIGKAFYVLFTEGPKAMLKKSLEANYIDSGFEVFKNAAGFGLFLFYRPEHEREANKLISEFSSCGLELKNFDKKDKNGVSILLFPEGDEKPEGVYIVINKKRIEDMSETYLLLLKSAYEVLDTKTENFSAWENRTHLSRLPYFLPETDDKDFYLSRFLLAQELIDFNFFYEKNRDFPSFLGNNICLSMRETPLRRESFKSQGIEGFSFFPGLRHRLGFLGCALSYKFLIKYAKDSEFKKLLVVEDDAVFPPDFEERFKKISDFLADKEFDIFSGLLAESESAEILGFFPHEGENIVLIDRLMSTVLNIYSERVFEYILKYDESNQDPFVNTIDKFINQKSLKIFCALPFLVGHSDGEGSTIWGSSSHYEDMISKSEKTLEQKLDEFLDAGKKTKRALLLQSPRSQKSNTSENQ